MVSFSHLTSVTVATEIVFLWYLLLWPWVKWRDFLILLSRRVQYILWIKSIKNLSYSVATMCIIL